MVFSRSEFGTCGIEAVHLVNMDTRVSLEVFFVKTDEICHTYKPQIHVWTYRYRPVSETFKILRFMVLSFEIKTKDFN